MTNTEKVKEALKHSANMRLRKNEVTIKGSYTQYLKMKTEFASRNETITRKQINENTKKVFEELVGVKVINVQLFKNLDACKITFEE